MEKEIRRLFNKDYSIKYHNWFTFPKRKKDSAELKLLKKNLVGKKFKIVGTENLDNNEEKFWLDSAKNCKETLLCLDNNKRYHFHRKKLFDMIPIIYLEENPNWNK